MIMIKQPYVRNGHNKIRVAIFIVTLIVMGRVVGLYRIILGTHSLAPLTKRYLIVLFGRVLLNPDGFSRFVRLFALTGLLAIARHRPTENPLEPR